MNKTTLTHWLIASAALTFAGCGDDTSAAEDDSGSSSTGSDPTTETPTSATNTDPTTGATDPTTGATDPTTGETDPTSETESAEESGSTTSDPNECALDDEASCIDEGTLLQCQDVDGVLLNVEVECDEGSVCAISGCASEIQQEFINQITLYVEEVQSRSAVAAKIDWDQLIVDGTKMIVAGDDTPDTLFRAARAIQLQIPQGHQWVRFGPGLCGSPAGLSYTEQTFYGACGRAHGDGVIVTMAADSNPLGLEPGDRVIGSETWGEGPSFLDELAAEPLCSSMTPTSEGAKRLQAAKDLFGLLREGDTITVINPEGEEREVEVPARLEDDPVGWCVNPIEGGYSTFEAQLTMRPDGVAVIRVPHFGPSENPFPSPLTAESYYQWVSDYVDRLAEVMESIPADAPIIWDARSNSGGAAEVPLAIVAGMPGAVRTDVSEGYVRVEGTIPFEFQEEPTPTFSFEVPEDDRLIHDAPTAVLVDSGTTSAADFFALGAKEYSDAILVGTPSTGNYGFGGVGPSILTGSVAELAHRIDFMQSRDMDGNPLEGYVITPDIVVEYDPADLANGIDTVLEAAVDAVLE